MIREIFVKNSNDFVTFVDKPLVADDVQAYQIVFQTGQDVTGCTPTITVTRADGVKIIGGGTADGTTATYMLSNNMYAVPGELIARLTVTSPTGSVLTDCELHFYVVPGNGAPDISGDDRVPVLNQLIIDATNAANYAKEQGDYAHDSVVDMTTPDPSDAGKFWGATDNDAGWQSAPGAIAVIDNLNSESGTDALSAKQGKVLNDRITTALGNIETVLDDLIGGDSE